MQAHLAYKKLKATLPAGAFGRIAQKFGVDQAHVTRIAKGEKENIEIYTALIEEAEAYRKQKQLLLERIKAL